MGEPDPNEPIPLNYAPTDSDRQRTGSAAFWGVYTACAFLGLFVLEPIVAIKLFGHRGDEGVECFNLASAGFMTAIAGALRRTAGRRRQPSVSLAIAAAMGLADFVPGYAVMFLFF